MTTVRERYNNEIAMEGSSALTDDIGTLIELVDEVRSMLMGHVFEKTPEADLVAKLGEWVGRTRTVVGIPEVVG